MKRITFFDFSKLQIIILFATIVAALLIGYFIGDLGFNLLIFFVLFCCAYLIFKNPFLGTLLFVGMVPLESSFLFTSSGVTFNRILGVYLLLLWAVNTISKHRKVILPPYLKWLIPLSIFGFFSMIWATNTEIVITRVSTLLQMVLLAIIIFDQANTKKQLNALLIVLFTSSIFATILGYFEINSLGTRELLTIGSSGAKNYASMIGVAFLSGILLFFLLPNKKLKVLSLISALICIYPLLISGERGVYLALIFAWLLILLITKQKFSYVLITPIIFILIYLFFQIGIDRGLINDYIRQRFNISQILEAGGTGRLDIWRIGLQIFENSPILGVGFGNFPENYRLFSNSFILKGPHNDLIGIGTELGTVGLVFYVGMIVDIIFRFLKSKPKHKERDLTFLYIWTGCIFIYMLTLGLTSVFFYRKLYWLSFVFIEIIIKLIKNENYSLNFISGKLNSNNTLEKN